MSNEQKTPSNQWACRCLSFLLYVRFLFFRRSTFTIQVHFQKLARKQLPSQQRHRTLSLSQPSSLKRKPKFHGCASSSLLHPSSPSHTFSLSAKAIVECRPALLDSFIEVQSPRWSPLQIHQIARALPQSFLPQKELGEKFSTIGH